MLQDSKLWMRHCHAAHCLSSSAANEGLARTAYGCGATALHAGVLPRMKKAALAMSSATRRESTSEAPAPQCRMSWKRMYVERPFVRTDGIYVSRNTYFRLGAVHWDVKNPVHLVVYYRYFRCAMLRSNVSTCDLAEPHAFCPQRRRCNPALFSNEKWQRNR